MIIKKFLSMLALVFATLLIVAVGIPSVYAYTYRRFVVQNTVPETSTATSKTVDEFINSIGLNTHFTYPDTPYLGQFAIAKQKLIDLGVTHIRDGVAKESYKYEPMNQLCDAGIKLSTGVARRVESWNGPLDFDKIDDEMQVIKDHYMNCIESIEGPNEYDLNHGSDPDWKVTIKRFTQAQHDVLKSDPQFANLPIIAPSISWYNAEGIGDMSQWFDYGNSHPYPGGAQPTAGLAENLERGATINGEKPVIATETGYHTAINNNGEVDAGWGQRGISDAASGKYIPRMLAEYFNAGVARTYLYEFIDEFLNPEKDKQESHFGMLRHDLSEKPAYTALRTLLTILKPGTDAPLAFQPGSNTLNVGWHHTPIVFKPISVDQVSQSPHREIPDFAKPRIPKFPPGKKPVNTPSPAAPSPNPTPDEQAVDETEETNENPPVVPQPGSPNNEEIPATPTPENSVDSGIETTKPDQVHSLILAGQPGEYFLLLWQEVKSYDYESKSDLDVAPVPVQVQLTPAGRAELYATMNDTNPEKPYQVYETTSSFEVNVPDSVSVVRVVR